MTYIVIFDNCQDGNMIYVIEDHKIFSRFDPNKECTDESERLSDEYIEKLIGLDGQYGGSTDIPPDLEEFLNKEFVQDDRYWKPISSNEEQTIYDASVLFIQTGWLA